MFVNLPTKYTHLERNSIKFTLDQCSDGAATHTKNNLSVLFLFFLLDIPFIVLSYFLVDKTQHLQKLIVDRTLKHRTVNNN